MATHIERSRQCGQAGKRYGRVYAILCVLAALLGSSCASDSRKPLYPVRGKVFFQKARPAAEALVVFHPLNDPDPRKNWPEGFPRGTVAGDGSFALSTYQTGDGAPAGEYAVTIVWSPKNPDDRERETPDRLEGRYSDPQQSKWRVTVKAEANDLQPFFVH